MEEKVLVIGGNGFIGYHLIDTLSWYGFKAYIGSRSKDLSSPNSIYEIYIDLKVMSDRELTSVLSKFDHVIFSAGADDRHIPQEDAWDFYYRENVTPCVRLARVSKESNLKQIIILGSYFSYFNRSMPKWQMAKHHPYVSSREKQLEESIAASNGSTHITSIEIPYVFGTYPMKKPLWCPLITYIKKTPIIFYSKGGTNIIEVEHLAKAIVRIINHKEKRKFWTIAGENVEWKSMIKMINHALGKNKPIVTIPTSIIKWFARLLTIFFKFTNKHPGIHPYHFVQIQTSKTFLDKTEIQETLDYESGDLQSCITKTVKACISHL